MRVQNYNVCVYDFLCPRASSGAWVYCREFTLVSDCVLYCVFSRSSSRSFRTNPAMSVLCHSCLSSFSPLVRNRQHPVQKQIRATEFLYKIHFLVLNIAEVCARSLCFYIFFEMLAWPGLSNLRATVGSVLSLVTLTFASTNGKANHLDNGCAGQSHCFCVAQLVQFIAFSISLSLFMFHLH